FCPGSTSMSTAAPATPSAPAARAGPSAEVTVRPPRPPPAGLVSTVTQTTAATATIVAAGARPDVRGTNSTVPQSRILSHRHGPVRRTMIGHFADSPGPPRSCRSSDRWGCLTAPRGDMLGDMPELRSKTSTHGRNMAGARALWRATGMTDDDFGKPIVAVANSFTQFVPGHVHLRN